MNVVICEDNDQDQKILTTYVQDLLTARRIQTGILVFGSGELLMQYISSRADPAELSADVYFLDIYMNKLTGVETAYKIKEIIPNACIVFTTQSREHMADGFEVGVVHYIVKPITREAVDKALARCLHITGKQNKFIMLQVNRIRQKILLADILMIESKDKFCLITTKESVLKAYVRLNDLECALNDSRFLRCHRSYLINMDHTLGMLTGGFQMANDALIPIKRGERIHMREKFQEYCFEKLRRGI